MKQRVAVTIGMHVRLRKRHPCGGFEWQVTRTGADVGLVCLTCRRRVMLEREEFDRRVIAPLPAASPSDVEARQ